MRVPTKWQPIHVGTFGTLPAAPTVVEGSDKNRDEWEIVITAAGEVTFDNTAAFAKNGRGVHLFGWGKLPAAESPSWGYRDTFVAADFQTGTNEAFTLNERLSGQPGGISISSGDTAIALIVADPGGVTAEARQIRLRFEK